MASSNTIIPEIVEEETPARYITAAGIEYPMIEKWLATYNFTYNRFFASFINYAINLAKERARAKTADKLAPQYNTLWVFDDNVPINVQGLIDAMAGYAEEHYDGGVTSGEIDLKDGREADNGEIQKAQKTLANLLWSNAKQRNFLKDEPYLEWLFGGGAKKKRNAKRRKSVRSRRRWRSWVIWSLKRARSERSHGAKGGCYGVQDYEQS